MSDSSLSSGSRVEASWIRQSDTDDRESCSNVDTVITRMVAMGLWMGTYCKGITNATNAIFQVNASDGMNGQMTHGFSASISSSEIIIVNPSSMSRFDGHGWGFGEPTSILKRARNFGKGRSNNEMDLLQELRVLTHPIINSHAHIVKLISLGWESFPGEVPEIGPVLFLEQSATGNLSDFIRQRTLDVRSTIDLFVAVAHAVDALHDCGIVHGDIKFENVLVFESKDTIVPKLCDFGFSTVLEDVKGERASLRGGTNPWSAPEISRELPFPQILLKRADVYSLGLFFWKLLLDGQNPFQHAFTCRATPAVLKVGRPPLLHFAVMTVLVRQEYKSDISEILGVLSNTLQLSPLKRKLKTVLRILTKQSLPRLHLPESGICTNTTLSEEFMMGNVCVPVRLRVLKHIEASAMSPWGDVEDPHLKSDPVLRSMLEISLGDAGLDLDDSPDAALKWITALAERGNLPYQAITLRMYKFFNKSMPPNVKQHAGEWLASGAVNGSLSAFLDYNEYWQELEEDSFVKAHNLGSPESFSFLLRIKYLSGTGAQTNTENIAELFDTQKVARQLKIDNSHVTLQRIYGLQDGNTLLHGAAKFLCVDTAEMLLRSSAVDINAVNDRGDTALLAACRSGCFPLIKMLCARGARADIANNYGETPLHWVMNVDNVSTKSKATRVRALGVAIDLLLFNGGDLNACAVLWSARAEFSIRLAWATGTPLHRAVSRRNVTAVQCLIQRGANPLALDGSSEALTAIDLAAHCHLAQILEILLSASQFDVNTQYSDGNTVFSRAIASVKVLEMITIHGTGYVEAIKNVLHVFLSHGFNPGVAKNGSSKGILGSLDALFVTVHYEKLAWVKCILSSPGWMEAIDINTPNGEYGMTVLHQSIHDHRKSIFRELLEAGADPTLKCSTNGQFTTLPHTQTTCLHLVAQQGDPDLFFAKRLLGYDLDVDASELWGSTPFLVAVMEGNFHIANLFLEHGADIDKMIRGESFNKGVGGTTLDHILLGSCDQMQSRLKFLIADPEDVGPPLKRYGRPASFHVRQDSTALHIFLISNNSKGSVSFAACLELLLKAFPNPSQINCRDAKQRTPLHIAAVNFESVGLKMLLDAGADSSVRDVSGKTALEIALQDPNLETMNKARRSGLLPELRQRQQRAVDILVKHSESASDHSAS